MDIIWSGSEGETADGYKIRPCHISGWRVLHGDRVAGWCSASGITGVIERDRILTRIVEKAHAEMASEDPTSRGTVVIRRGAVDPGGEALAVAREEHKATVPDPIQMSSPAPSSMWIEGDEVWLRGRVVTHADEDGGGKVKVDGIPAPVWLRTDRLHRGCDVEERASAAETVEPARVSVYSLTLNAFQRRTRRTIDDTAPSGALTILALGLAGESGEVCDLIKKIEGHGHPVDGKKICEELGDALFYVAAIADRFGIPLAEVAEHNERKLRERYPDGFTTKASIARADVEKGGE